MRCKCGKTEVQADWTESTDSLGRTVYRGPSNVIAHLCLSSESAKRMRDRRKSGDKRERTVAAEEMFEAIKQGYPQDEATQALIKGYVLAVQEGGDRGLRALEGLERLRRGQPEMKHYYPGMECPTCHRMDTVLTFEKGAVETLCERLGARDKALACTVEDCSSRVTPADNTPEGWKDFEKRGEEARNE